jgi:hypothetical protein
MRLIVLLAAAAVLVGGLAVVRIRADRQVAAALDRARARAADVRVTPSQLLATSFSPDSGVADSLGVRPSEISLHQSSPPDWCLDVDIRRLGATGHAAFVVSPDGVLHATARC